MKTHRLIYLTVLLYLLLSTAGNAQNFGIENQQDSSQIRSVATTLSFATNANIQKSSNAVFQKEGIQPMDTDRDVTVTTEEIPVPLSKSEPFLAIGSRWIQQITQLSPGELRLKMRHRIGGKWSAWQPVKKDGHLTTHRDILVGQLQFLPKTTTSVQFKIFILASRDRVSPALKSVVISFTSPGATPASKLKQIRNKKAGQMPHVRDQGQNYPMPDFVSRTGWDCPDGQQPSGAYPLTDITHQIIHHSAGTNASNDWPAVVRAIWDYHVNTNGWSDIGYNWLVDPNGVIYQGRGWIDGDDEVQGAHFCGTNSNTMGVCVMGNFEEVSPTEDAKTSLSELLAWKSDENGIDPLGSRYHASSQLQLKTISGHRDGCSTLCPGENLYMQLPQIRNKIDGFIEGSTNAVTAIDSVRNYPNPFSGSTTITFTLAEAGIAELTIWDITGRLVEEISHEYYEADSHTEIWKADGYAAGIYFCRIKFKGHVTVQKMVLMK